MARRRRRRARTDGIPSIRFAAPVGLAVFVLALIVRLMLTAEGLVFSANVEVAKAVEATAYTWPVTAEETPQDVAFRSGLVLVGRGLDALARDWTGASSSERAILTTGAVTGAILPAAIVWLAALMGLGPWRAALAGLAIALSPLHVATSTSGDLSSLAALFSTLAIGVSLIASLLCSVPVAAVAGLVTSLALGSSASAIAALAACVVALCVASEKRRWLLMVYALTAAPGIAAAIPGTIAMFVYTVSSVPDAGVLSALRSIAAATTPIGLLFILVGTGAALVSRQRGPALAWLAAALALHAPGDPELAALWTAPGALLLASAALARWQRVLIPVAVIVVVLGFVRGFETLAYRHDRVGPERVARLVASTTPERAIVVSADPAYLDYYARREPRAWPPIAPTRKRTPMEHAESLALELHALAERGRPVLALRSAFVAPGGELLEEKLRERFELTPTERLETETVHRRPLRLARIDEVIYTLVPRR